MQERNTTEQLRLIIVEREKRVKQLESEQNYRLSQSATEGGFTLHNTSRVDSDEQPIEEERTRPQSSSNSTSSRPKPEPSSSHTIDRESISSRNSNRNVRSA